MKRVRMEVCPSGDGWKVSVGTMRLVDTLTQAEAIARARQHAEKLVKSGLLVTLKIKRPNGTIREERTYPRSSDPRRSEG